MTTQNLRIESGIDRGLAFQIEVDGQQIDAYKGETLATVLQANGWKVFRYTTHSAEPRGLYCGMGLCFDCLVTVNGRRNVRACQTVAQPGDRVERQR
jgi:predicted molibdopterin-dependent oxidoreductase YjgC